MKNKNILNKSSCHYALVSTIIDNQSKFTNCKFRNAKLALDLHRKIGRPSIQSLIDMLLNSMIRNYPVKVKDAWRVFTIYGKDIPSEKEKTKRQNPNHLNNLKLLTLLDFIIKWHLNVTLCIVS